MSLNRVRQENITAQVPVKPIQSSQFDLSYDHKTSFNMSDLVVAGIWETLPGDIFNVSANVLLRFPKLFFPIMHRVETHYAVFYVPNDIIWDRWKAYIKPDLDHSNVTTTPVTMARYTLQFSNIQEQFDAQRYRIAQYMGFPFPKLPPTAGANAFISMLPIAAYWKIWNDFYRHPQLQFEFGRDEYDSELPILRGDPDFWNYTQIMTDHYTAFRVANDTEDNSLVGWEYLRKRNWNPDYFTTANYEPQYGQASIQIPMIDINYPTLNGDEPAGPWQLRQVVTDATGPNQAVENRSTHVWGTGLQSSGGTDWYLDTQGPAATIQQLRYAEQMQLFLERLNRTGDRYRDLIRGFWGVDPSPGSDDYTVYVGSINGTAIISDVMASAEWGGNGPQGTGLGAYAGKIVALENTPTFQFQAREHGWLIALFNVQPRSSYYQGVPKFFLRDDWEDHAWDEFAHIGDQPIQNRELLWDWDTPWDDASQTETWGYTRRFESYRYSNDVISGELRNEYELFHLGRDFTGGKKEVSDLSYDFLLCQPQVSKVFEIGKEAAHVVYAQIWNNCQVIRNLPKHGTPMS